MQLLSSIVSFWFIQYISALAVFFYAWILFTLLEERQGLPMFANVCKPSWMEEAESGLLVSPSSYTHGPTKNCLKDLQYMLNYVLRLKIFHEKLIMRESFTIQHLFLKNSIRGLNKWYTFFIVRSESAHILVQYMQKKEKTDMVILD